VTRTVTVEVPADFIDYATKQQNLYADTLAMYIRYAAADSKRNQKRWKEEIRTLTATTAFWEQIVTQLGGEA
jgi:hypothetical protein